MEKAFYGSEDPIAAIATAAGESALAIVRTGGAGSIGLLSKVFSRPEKLREAAGNTVVHGWIALEGKRIDDVLVSVYRAPASFTGEDGADIACHGGGTAPRAVMAALLSAGFREALRGEFSFRAFMNGKIDLTRAESIMEIVAAKTERARAHAAERLAGTLEREIAEIREEALLAMAETELLLDYPEDEIDDAAPDHFPGAETVKALLPRLRALSAAWERERLFQDGALVAIAGRPNAGKSSLFNLLLREERSIVAELPGTTRDWIEAWISIEGIPLRLADTAGLREAGGTGGVPAGEAGEIEKMGIGRSRELIARADLVLYVIDGTAGITGEDRAYLAAFTGGDGPPLLAVWNKADLAPAPPGGAFSGTSAKTGAGTGELCKEIAALLESRRGGADGAFADSGAFAHTPGPGTERQKTGIDAAVSALEEALALAERGEPLDITASRLRAGVDALGEITGEISTPEILETMFGKFCLGK